MLFSVVKITQRKSLCVFVGSGRGGAGLPARGRTRLLHVPLHLPALRCPEETAEGPEATLGLVIHLQVSEATGVTCRSTVFTHM